MASPTVNVTIKTTVELYATVEKLAKEDDRPMSSMLRILVKEALAARNREIS